MRRSRRGSVIATLASLCLVWSFAVASPVAAQTWTSAGNLDLARSGHEATLLADGRVLVTGGWTPGGSGYNNPRQVEIYDPVTNSWSVTGSTAHGRIGHTATALADGRALVVGGQEYATCAYDVTAELYDPSTGTWTFTGNLPYGSFHHTATLLEDGRVLVAGGGNRCGQVYSAVTIYDPSTGTWTPTGPMNSARENHSAVRLADGRVLVAGGQDQSFWTQASAEIFDPGTGSWTPTGSMATTRGYGSSPFLTLLSDGRVMAAGAWSGYGNDMTPNGPEVEIYDPATGTWAPTGSMSVVRAAGSFSLLSDGSVLAVGGTDASNVTHASVELWDPTTGTWSDTASLTEARSGHSATVLANGMVLVASGYTAQTQTYQTSAELYELESDDTPPDITITTPADGASYALGSTVLADYSCDDGDGSGVATCAGPVPSGSAIDTSTVGAKTFTVTATDNEGNESSVTHNYNVVYGFAGFLSPVNNLPVLNAVKAGAAVPVKFSLGGDQGIDIFATGYPKSQTTSCEAGGTVDGIEETVTAGSSSLSYDALTEEYTYVWKTQKGWANTCRQLVLKLKDGTFQRANFQFR